jgi:hypothetical protein
LPHDPSTPIKLSEFNFGEYDARREFLRNESYFIKTFIDPISFPLVTLSNKTNYIIVGQKGAGKTACQLYLENDRSQKQGYLSGLISFYDDLTSDDYKDFSSTQRMNLISLDQLSKIENQYDFKEIWKRILFIRVAKMLKEAGFDNSFVQFCLSTTGGTNSIIDGIKRSLKIEVKIPMQFLEAKVEFDPSKLKEQAELTVSDFNKIAEQLLTTDCRQYRLYFFIDELVISNMNTKSDEYRARLCLIRDIVRSCCLMNDFCVKHDLDMHFICSLRPEIRTKLNELDPEISKVMDGNDVFLSWDRDSLLEILTQKIVIGAPREVEINADEFLPSTITFGSQPADFISFLLNNSWYKPRDIVRFLKVYAKVNPSHTSITEEGTKECLNEYARISAVELFEQISVQYSAEVLSGIRTGIRRRRYTDAASLAESLKPHVEVDPMKLVEQLYIVGVIGNVDSVNGQPRFFWSFRQEEHLDHEMQINVHPGLLNYFNVRHR